MNKAFIQSVSFALTIAAPLVAAPQDDLPDRAELEAKFEKTMSGCTMVGHFTVDGEEAPPQQERYTITKVSKIRDDEWKFEAVIEYGGKSVTVPLAVPVRWAGDTPMIQVTDMKIPTLGTYTARVLIYRDRYAGTWSGGDHGGQMYGRIERTKGDGGGENAKSAGVVTNDTWGTWRGSDGLAIGAGKPPVRWSEDENIRWKVALPGMGSSSPIVWKDRVYVTTAIPTGRQGEAPKAEPEPRPERRGRGGRRGRGRGGRGRAPTEIHEFAVIALDRADGSVVWKRVVTEAVPHEAGHPTASQASSSPITDGEHIIAHFGSRGLFCLDMKGEVVWQHDLGTMRTRNRFGEGSSPALHGDTVVINWDHEGDSFIAAFDKRSGEELWRNPRDEVTSWATPIVVSVDDREQVIINATGASRGYDLATGEEIWSCPGMTVNCIPSPIHSAGLVYLMSGFRGSMLQAIKLQGAAGDISDSDHIVWSHSQGTSYVPSALLYDKYFYFFRVNSGVLTCVDANNGEPHYEGQKIKGMKTVYASPVGANGHVYMTSREGRTVVIKLGPGYEEVASNQLDDVIDASAALVGNEIFFRGQKSLYCIAEE